MLAALAVGVVGQGAFHRPAQRVVALLLAAAGVRLILGSGTGRARLRQPLVGACALLGGWALVRALLAGDPGAARSTVLLLAGVVVIVLTCAACNRGQRAQLLVGIVVLGVVVALSGWAGVAWRRPPWALEAQGLWRAATTITYANVAAGLLAAVTLLSLAHAAARPVSTPMITVANCLLLTGLGATLSRGGAVALAAGALVLVRTVGLRTIVKSALAPVMGAGVALAGLVPSMPASSPARPFLAASTLLLGVVLALAAAKFGRRMVVVTVVAAACAALLVVEGRQLVHAGSAVARPRLTASSPDRGEETRAALRAVRTDPVLGVGQGNADLMWVGPDGSLAIARYAHNEYLQVLAELGLVGLGLLLGVFFVVGHLVRQGREVTAVPGVWAGVTAALVALAVHGLFDFGWHVPVIPLTGALMVGLVTSTERKEQT